MKWFADNTARFQTGGSSGWPQLVRGLAHGAGDPGLNPGPAENFSLKLLIYDLPDGYSES